MPAVNILIKPASSRCNMRCKYCFYAAIADSREVADLGIMTEETLEALIRAGINYADNLISFAFQGGEPTIAGLGFFRRVVELQQLIMAESGKKLHIHNAIQTNGYLIDETWADFLHDHHFLVGLSLDGPQNVHDKNRLDAGGAGTFSRVIRAAELFRKHQVDFNILSVVTGQNAMSIRRIYRFFQKQKFHYLQFIPCLEPIDDARGSNPYYLSVDQYGDFLIELFNLWYEDFIQGYYVSIRHIDNWVGMLLGEPPESCSMNGRCSTQFVVEGDGGVYPCDFYVFDEWKLGNIRENTFGDLLESQRMKDFYQESLPVPESCRKCKYLALCRNGCRRDRVEGVEEAAKTVYCQAYRRFFDTCGEKLLHSARIVRRYHLRDIEN